ncbi:NAD(P)/FAD-dependent oxidoreductase [Streptomyces longwoodensis]|uniref:NAD(P)/FAD-dependent oxidoreductase n=1 Tax=Streptomyces longwoodensis TaxID=68231 RepID=UPI0037F76EB0
MSAREVDVLVVGAGPAGLVAAARLAALGAGRVEVLDGDQGAGGAPRYGAHRGYGTWPRVVTGPAYARRLVAVAQRAGAVVRTGVTALDWAGPLALETAGPLGVETVGARAVVLATGARERPRAARLVPGTRPAGVYTTGELQRAVHQFGQHIGTRAVVVGAGGTAPAGEATGPEDATCVQTATGAEDAVAGAYAEHAAVTTVRAAGASVVALVTGVSRARTGRAPVADPRPWRGVPLLTGATVTELLGQGRLSGVRVRHRDGGTAVLPCDTVVFTGAFVPDQALARRGGLTLATGTRCPAVDEALRTSRPGVFATGALVRPTASAPAAARAGARTAHAVLAHLRDRC